MGTLRKVKGVHPLMDKGFGLLWYICMGEVQIYNGNPCLPATSDFYSSQPLRELTIGNVGIDHLSGVNNAIKILFLDVS